MYSEKDKENNSWQSLTNRLRDRWGGKIFGVCEHAGTQVVDMTNPPRDDAITRL